MRSATSTVNALAVFGTVIRERFDQIQFVSSESLCLLPVEADRAALWTTKSESQSITVRSFASHRPSGVKPVADAAGIRPRLLDNAS